MKETRPDWYSIAKGGLGDSLFTEEMKREVGRIVEQPRARRRSGRWIAGTALVALCVAAVLLILPLARPDSPAPSPAVTDEPSPVPSPDQPLPTPESPEPEPSETPPPPIADSEVRLAYESPENHSGDYPVETDRVEAKRIDKASVRIQRTIEVEGAGSFAIYVREEGDSQLYAGMEVRAKGTTGHKETDELYEIGPIGELVYADDVSVTPSSAFGQSGLRIFGACGANCVANTWIRFEESAPDVPFSDFRLYTHAQEVDLDEDGILEVVATETSTVGKVQIYKRIADRIMFVDVNEALQAEHPGSVVYEGSRRIFLALLPDRTLTYEYGIRDDVMKLTDEHTVETDLDRLIADKAYDGSESLQLEVDGETYESTWFANETFPVGAYLPNDGDKVLRKILLTDGLYYTTGSGSAFLTFRAADEGDLPELSKEADLAMYGDYMGTEFKDDEPYNRRDYFVYDRDAKRPIYVVLRYADDNASGVRPLLLAIAANIRYVPEA
ncbi:hypothetical protein [Cohnella sp.]|uniref:hypothetical protein n=1 Tax=Cohnella sp. TaxID=1883426 RepID=UPI003561EB7F